MNNESATHKWLAEKQVLAGELNDVAEAIADSLESSIPHTMRLNIAHSILTKFASEFQVAMLLPDGARIPTNGIFFSLSKSGNGKDSSEQKAKRMFDYAYDKIDEFRNKLALERAVALAETEGLEDQQEITDFVQKFMRKNKPKPLFVSVSTEQGLVKYLNELERDGIGSGYLFSGEIGTELVTSGDIVSNIKLLAEVYDSGQKKIRVLKSEENQSGAIDFMPFSSLMMSSPEVIIYDEEAKRKFKQEFVSKLSRRSFFNYDTTPKKPKPIESVDEMLMSMRDKSNTDIEKARYIHKIAINVADKMIERFNDGRNRMTMDISSEAWDIFNVYKAYNEERADGMGHKNPIAEKEMRHRQWKAFKLAGALAIINHPEDLELKPEDYKQAIRFAEMMSDDISVFEEHLKREEYELFVEYCELECEGNPLDISTHELITGGFIKARGKSETQITELVKLANSAHDSGIFISTQEGARYEPKVKPLFGASFKKSEGTKEERASKVHDGFKYKETEWDSLVSLLRKDTAYCPFEFKDGKRSNANIMSGTSWIVLDIDDSDITYIEAADQLQDFSAMVATTSNPDNPFKFRVILKLDQYVQLDQSKWKKFIGYVARDLGLECDLLPMSQIYFGYAGADVMISEGDEYPASEAMIHANETIEEKEQSYTPAEAKGLLANPFSTFETAYDCDNGKGSIELVKAGYYMMKLGADLDYIEHTIKDISNYWVEPMSPERLEKTVLSQFRRKFQDRLL